jgi:hypothetical protein
MTSPPPGIAAAGYPGETDRERYLHQICDLLWPSPATVTFGRPAAGPVRAKGGGRGGETEFILLFGLRRPRLLIPAASGAGAAAVRGYGQPRSRAARLGARALSLAVATGLGGAVLRSRIMVHVPPGTSTIESYLGEALGRDLLISTYLSTARANRKPVLQLLSPQGQPVGFAKIGTSPLTRALVQAEHDALTRLGQAVLSALPVWLRHRPVGAAQLAAAMNSVASVGGLSREPLAGGSYLPWLTSRLAAADASAERDTLLGTLGTLAARSGDARLVLGSWHGDWTPWNMASTRGGLLVWDWERFTEGAPLGFDALHYQLQSAVAPGRRDPLAAAAGCVEDAPRSLAAFGLGASDARITGILYLADLATRYLADRQAQAGAKLGAPGAWLIPSITDQVSRL